MDTKFTTMQYDNRHLVIKNVEGKKPLVIAECYLPEIAETICELLKDAENQKQLEIKQAGQKARA